MEKFKILLVALFISFSAIGQQYTPMTAAGYQMKRIKSDSTLHIPSFCGVPTLRNSTAKEGALAMDTCAGLLYMWTRANGWDTVNTSGGTTIDTTSLSNRIDAKLSKSDSSIYYTKYRSDSSRTNIYTAIDSKLNKSDTTNAFLISVSQPNDSSLTFVKGTTSTNYIIRSSSAGSATRLVTTVYNNTGSTIAKGSVVYISGRHSSNLPTIALAEANNESNSYKTFAVVENDIPTSNSGIVIQAGNIGNLNLPTSTYTDGDIVYLSPTVPGGITTTKPLAPNHICKIGSITRAHPTFGSIEVKIENGWQMDELSDVQIAAVPDDGDVLQFSQIDSLWHDVSVTTAIGSNYLKPSDSSTYQTKYRSDSARTNTYIAINSKLNSADSTLYQTKFRSDSARTNTYTAINSKLNSADSTIYQTKFRSDSARTNTYTSLNLKLNASDSATYYTKFRSDSSRTNIYTSIAGKFTLPSLTSGSVLFSNGTTIAQKNANLYWDNTNNRLGIGTNAPTTLFQLTQSNTDYTNTNGAGSHIYMTNPATLNGQNVVASFINGAMVAKWRTDSQGNISWVAGSTGSHNFYTKGDFSTGQIQMQIFNGGNVQIASSPVGGQNSDAGFKLDVQGTFKSTGRYTAYVSKTGAYTATTTDEIISADATSAAFQITLPTAVSKTGQVYTIKRANAGVNTVTVGTTSSQTIDGSTTYSLIAQYKFVTVVSNGANWLIIANN